MSKLKEQNQRLEATIRNVPGMVWEAFGNPQLKYQQYRYISNYAKKLTGYTSKEISSSNSLYFFIHPEDRKRVEENFTRFYVNSEEGTSEFRCITKCGDIIWTEVFTAPILDKNKHAVGMRGVTIDITQRKKTELLQKYLFQANAMLSSTLDFQKTLSSVADLAVPHIADLCTIDIIDANGDVEQVAASHMDPKKIALLNKLAKIRQIDYEAPHGLPHILRTGHAELYPHITDTILAANTKNKQELKILKSLGLQSVIIVPLTIRKKTFGAITMAVTRESKRYFSNLDLLYAEELARRAWVAIDNALLYRSTQKAIADRDEFISIASHELRSPITVIKGFTQLLESHEEKNSNKFAVAMLKRIDSQVNRITKLISELFDFSKIKHGKLNLNRKQYSLAKIINEVISEFNLTYTSHTIYCRGTPNKNIVCDKFRIQQVMANLLSNAVKYSPGKSKIVIHIKNRPTEVCIGVQDFGVGMDSQNQKHIFDQYYRAEPLDSNALNSLGLGLYISSGIIDRHGGRIWVKSKKNIGSTFFFTLPFDKKLIY